MNSVNLFNKTHMTAAKSSQKGDLGGGAKATSTSPISSSKGGKKNSSIQGSPGPSKIKIKVDDDKKVVTKVLHPAPEDGDLTDDA